MRDQSLVLVVDDQAPNRKLLADLLGAKGYAVATAESGEEALAAIPRVKPDLVLLDVVMPGLSGYEVCRAIRADPATAHITVVGLSANAMPHDIEKGLQAGFFSYLTKFFFKLEHSLNLCFAVKYANFDNDINIESWRKK